MKLGAPKESAAGETRVALTPDIVKRLKKAGFDVQIEKDAGVKSGISNQTYLDAGATVVDAKEAWASDVVFKLNPPSDSEILQLKSGSLLLSMLEPHQREDLIKKLAETKINSVAMELIPRTSRAQSMDVLSSQANIAGYRAVIEAATRYKKFFPMMMTSAGSAKPARVCILGIGVAGLQAIATAKRLGANVEAYDVRPETKEQAESLGAKFIDLDIGEEGSGDGGYAKELSEEAKKKQQALLAEKLTEFDIIITTANIPGRKAPVLVTEETFGKMKFGSVIVDMAAANGGNCPLSKPDEVIEVDGKTLVGWTNYPAMVSGDSSGFYSRNLFNLLGLFLEKGDAGPSIKYDFEDDIVAAACVTHNGEIRRN